MAFSEFATRRPLLTFGVAGLLGGGAFLAYSMMAHASVDVRAVNGSQAVEVHAGDEASSQTVYLRNSFDQVVMVGGTQVTDDDRAAAEDAVYDEEHFKDMVDEAAERARVERELFDLDGDGRVSDVEVRRIADAVGTGSLSEGDREAIIRQLHEDGSTGGAGSHDVDSGASDAERERIRNLFQDRGDESDDGDPGLDGSIFGSSGTDRSSDDDAAERERVRQLFLDQGDNGGRSVGEGSARDGSDVSDEERARLHNLFQDQGEDSANAGSGGDGVEVAVARPAPARCGAPRRSFFNILPEDLLFCSDSGHAQPELIDGDCPVSACILRFGESDGIDDFLGAR